jgi:hypothetical protein
LPVTGILTIDDIEVKIDYTHGSLFPEGARQRAPLGSTKGSRTENQSSRWSETLSGSGGFAPSGTVPASRLKRDISRYLPTLSSATESTGAFLVDQKLRPLTS